MQLVYSLESPIGLPGQISDTGYPLVVSSFIAQEAIPAGRGVVLGASANTCRLPQRNVATIVFDDDFTDDNTINMDVNGEAITEVEFTDDNDTTLGLIVDAINALEFVEAESSGSHTIIVKTVDRSVALTVSNIVVADDDTQTTATVTYGTAIVFSADFVTANEIDLDVNEQSITTVTFSVDNATTLAAVASAIEVADETVTAITLGAHTIIVTTTADPEVAPLIESVAVTQGASQATSVVSPMSSIVFEDDFTEDNTINLKVNNESIEQVDFDTDNATTLGLIVTAISAIDDVTATGSGAHTIYVIADTALDDAVITNVVVADGDPATSYTLTHSSDDVFLGVALSGQHVQSLDGNTDYSIGDVVSICSRGKVYVTVEQTLTKDDSVFVRSFASGSNVRGAFRKDSSSGNAFQVTPAKWLIGATSGNVAELQINMP